MLEKGLGWPEGTGLGSGIGHQPQPRYRVGNHTRYAPFTEEDRARLTELNEWDLRLYREGSRLHGLDLRSLHELARQAPDEAARVSRRAGGSVCGAALGRRQSRM